MFANEIEGVEKLVSDGVGDLGVGFRSDNMEVNAAAPESGNVKFTVMPKGGGEEACRADACAHCYSYLLRRLGFASADIFGLAIAESSLRSEASSAHLPDSSSV